MTAETGTHEAGPKLLIRVLSEQDVPRLSLSHWSRIGVGDAQRLVRGFPGRSVWIPETMEYAIAGPWRHRDDIAQLVELSAVRHPASLARACLDRVSALGGHALVTVETQEVRSPSCYQRAEFDLLQEVIAFELDPAAGGRAPTSALNFRLADPRIESDLGDLMRVDSGSFPWLWRNSPTEFREYAEAAGVELHIGSLGGNAVAYIGITAYLGWGHLDRIAVLPDVQGKGLGLEALAFAVQRLTGIGAKRVGLSTQLSNTRSQQLYQRFGFTRKPDGDYRLYGKLLRPPAEPGILV